MLRNRLFLRKIRILIIWCFMIVCVCYRVNDAEIQAAIDNGADSRLAVAAAIHGAGTKCGRCGDMIDDMLAQAKTRQKFYSGAAMYYPQSATA